MSHGEQDDPSHLNTEVRKQKGWGVGRGPLPTYKKRALTKY